MQDKVAQAERLAMQVSINSIIVNLILSVGKLAAGILANSAAMISDAIHSASDVFSTFIVMAGVKISNKASDAEHQYGHERLECVAAIILAIVLALTGLGIGYAGLEKYSMPPPLISKSPAVWHWPPLLFPLSLKKVCSGILKKQRSRSTPAP